MIGTRIIGVEGEHADHLTTTTAQALRVVVPVEMSSDLLFSSAKVFFLTRATVANHFNCKNFSANLPRLWRWKYESWWIVALIVIEFSCITYLGSGFDLFVRGGTEHFSTTTLFLSKIDNFFAVSSWMSILGRYLSCSRRRVIKMENLSKERKKVWRVSNQIT